MTRSSVGNETNEWIGDKKPQQGGQSTNRNAIAVQLERFQKVRHL